MGMAASFRAPRGAVSAVLAGALALVGLASAARAQAVAPPRVQTVAAGLEHPWAVAFLPGGRFLVTERPGRLRQLPWCRCQGHIVTAASGGPVCELHRDPAQAVSPA